MTFDIAWTRRVAHQWRTKADDWVIEATLTERVLLGGKPAIKVICRIAAIDEDKIDEEAARDRFWHAARARLGKLYRLDGHARDGIERLLALKVPRPAPIGAGLPASQAAE